MISIIKEHTNEWDITMIGKCAMEKLKEDTVTGYTSIKAPSKH
jgi:hypothetical protein